MSMGLTSDHGVPDLSLKRRSVTLLVVAEVAAMTLWFVSSATLADQRDQLPPGVFSSALLVSSVPAGFVLGALFVAIVGIADRFDPRRVFAMAALVAATANAAILLVVPGSLMAIGLRMLTGFCLAGVYPVGMKMMVSWGKADRGWLVGLLVGGLTFGSAAPHLLSWAGGSNWQLTTLLSSALSVLAAGLVLRANLGPHHTPRAVMNPRLVRLAWTDIRIRRAFIGYLGHMWELYAMWAWIAPATAASFALQMPDQAAHAWSKLTAFVAIASGALLCPFAGRLADRIGKAELTMIAMACSGSAALLAAWVFAGPVWLVATVFIFWGLTIIPDSAQFSALVADHAPPEATGSLMALQTALGFALTILTVQITPLIAAHTSWPFLFCLLALGPAVGLLSMQGLMRTANAMPP